MIIIHDLNNYRANVKTFSRTVEGNYRGEEKDIKESSLGSFVSLIQLVRIVFITQKIMPLVLEGFSRATLPTLK